MKRAEAAAAVILLVASACSADDASTTTAPDEVTTTVKPPPKAPSGNLTEIPDWFQNEDTAPEDLVRVIADQLDAGYVGSMSIVWPNGGIGCSSGGNELQVVTAGYVIYFESSASLHRVHSTETGRWVECDLARPLEGVPVLHS